MKDIHQTRKILRNQTSAELIDARQDLMPEAAIFPSRHSVGNALFWFVALSDQIGQHSVAASLHESIKRKGIPIQRHYPLIPSTNSVQSDKHN